MQPREDARGCFVEASAGTGKTHNLVTEIASAIESGVPVDRIAAVTFTHARRRVHEGARAPRAGAA